MTATPLERPWPVKAITSFAWLLMASFGATQVAAFAAPHLDVFGEYAGRLIWVPYLWIASLPWWRETSQVERRSIVKFARLNLWVAIVLGLIDLRVFGWSSHEPESIFSASEWRFVAYWPISAAWLWLLQGPAVTAWIAGGARVESHPSAVQ